MDIISLFLNSLLFIVAIALSFYIPGQVIIYYCKFKLTSLEKYIFPIGLGFISFTFLSYILDWLHLTILMYSILLIFIILFIKHTLWRVSSIAKIDSYALLIISCLVLLFAFPLLLSGVYTDGVRLININSGDSMFHLSMIHELQNHFLPDHPGYAGARLSGYHVFADYVWAKVLNIFPINDIFLFFQFEPIFTGMLWGTSVYLFMKRWTNSTTIGLWAVFLTQYGGSFVYIMRIFGHSAIALDSGFGMLQAFVSLINPPFSTSIVVVMFGLFSLLCYLQTKQKTWFLPILLFFGLAAEFKVYSGILVFGGFSLFVFINFLQNIYTFSKTHKFKTIYPVLTYIGVFIGIICIFLGTYFPLTGRGGFLVWDAYWAPIDVVRSNLPFMNYDNQMYVYAQLHLFHRIVWLQVRIFLMFLFGNLGSRSIGWLCVYFYPKKKVLFSSSFTWMLITMMSIAFFIPLFFIQSIKPFEITQMYNYFLFFAALFGAIGIGSLLSLHIPKLVKVCITVIIIGLTIPSMTATISDYSFTKIPRVSAADYQGIRLLRQQKNYNATVLVLPLLTDSNSFSKVDSWIHAANMIVPALSNKSGFFDDENISIPDDMQARVNVLSQLTTIEDANLVQQGNTQLQNTIMREFKQYHIAYIYSFYKLSVVNQIHLTQIDVTPGAYIYKVL